jgi:hypothetical protein
MQFELDEQEMLVSAPSAPIGLGVVIWVQLVPFHCIAKVERLGDAPA